MWQFVARLPTPVQLDAGLVADVDAAVALDVAVVDEVVAALQGEAVAAAQVHAAAAQIEQVAAAHPMVAAALDQHAPGAGAADGAARDRDVAAAADHDRTPAGGLDGEVAHGQVAGAVGDDDALRGRHDRKAAGRSRRWPEVEPPRRPVDVILARLVQLLQHVLDVEAAAGLEVGVAAAGTGWMQPQLARAGVDVVEVEHVVGPVGVGEHVHLDVLGIVLPGTDPVSAGVEDAA